MRIQGPLHDLGADVVLRVWRPVRHLPDLVRPVVRIRHWAPNLWYNFLRVHDGELVRVWSAEIGEAPYRMVQFVLHRRRTHRGRNIVGPASEVFDRLERNIEKKERRRKRGI